MNQSTWHPTGICTSINASSSNYQASICTIKTHHDHHKCVTSLCNTGILRHSLVGGSKESSTCEHLWASVSWKKKMRYPITPNSWTPCRTLPDLVGPCRTLPASVLIHPSFLGLPGPVNNTMRFYFYIVVLCLQCHIQNNGPSYKKRMHRTMASTQKLKIGEIREIAEIGSKISQIKMRHGPRRPNFGFLRVPHCFVPHIGIQRCHLHNISAWLECCNQICSDEPPSPRLCHKSFSMVLPMFLLRKCRSSSCMSQAVWPFKIKKYTGRNMLTTSIAVIICFINHKTD